MTGWLFNAATALMVARALHFAAACLAGGALLFRACVAAPAADSAPAANAIIDRKTRRLASIGVAVAVASSLLWFVLTAADMGNLPFIGALDPVVLQTVLEATQFGNVFAVRIALAILIGAGLAFDHIAAARWLTLAASLAYLATITYTGHGGSGYGAAGNFQAAADMLHLLAAAAWIGGLFPLAFLLRTAGRYHLSAWSGFARTMTLRFSVLGLVSVGTLIATGLVNSWYLVGSIKALVGTEYGRVLMVKLALFALMLGLATVNRLVLTPRLVASRDGDDHAQVLWQLTRNSVAEILLGLTILAIVGGLGTLHPAAHFMN